MSSYTNGLTAEQLIRYIGNDYVELSHDKVRIQRDDHMKICRDWLQHKNEQAEKSIIESLKNKRE